MRAAARRDHKGLLLGTRLLKDTGRHDEGTRGLTVVVEAPLIARVAS